MIQIDEEKIQAHLGEGVRSTVEETLNAMLEETNASWTAFPRHLQEHGRKACRCLILTRSYLINTFKCFRACELCKQE